MISPSDNRIHEWLKLDPGKTVATICEGLQKAVFEIHRRKGVVVAVSGGIDSSVCAALAVAALGKEKVFGLLLPEKESSTESLLLGELLCRQLGITYDVINISSTLDAIGCYRIRDDAIRTVFPDYGDKWKSKLVISQNILDTKSYNYFKIVVETPDGDHREKRLPLNAYLEVVAATNFKQRIRKTMEYFQADRLMYAVAGTPNRLEYDQGFFVKNGDGSADVKPIAHLYKSQVYAIGRFLGLPEVICSSSPTTDTYSLQQGQDEFYFVLPYDKMDLILFGLNHGKTSQEVAVETNLTPEQVERIFGDIRIKRKTTLFLHKKPILIEPIPEIQAD